MIQKKKTLAEQIDAMFMSDVQEIKYGLEVADRMFMSDVQEVRRWGRPQLYDDDFHRKKRECMRRLRSPK